MSADDDVKSSLRILLEKIDKIDAALDASQANKITSTNQSILRVAGMLSRVTLLLSGKVPQAEIDSIVAATQADLAEVDALLRNASRAT